jgi:ATP-dependent Lon protease
MEVLEVSGYVSEEKAVIAERYLAPQAKDASGLGAADVVLERDAVDVLIKYYCRESGVRNLKKHIDKVGVILQLSTAESLSWSVVDLSEGCP